MELKAQYKDYTIRLYHWDMTFEILKDDVVLKTKIKTLEACQKWIDDKDKQVFKRIPVLNRFGLSRERTPGEAASVVDGSHVWIVSSKNRRMMKASDVWLDTPGNRTALEIINHKLKQIALLQADIEAIENYTDRLTVEMMTETPVQCIKQKGVQNNGI